MSVKRKVTVPDGKIGHDACPYVRPVVVRADCRMTDGQTIPDRLTISSSVSRRCTEKVDSVVLRFTAEDAERVIAA
jgi:hypothetical protein